MAVTVVSSGVVIALLDPADRHHQAAVHAVEAVGDNDLLMPATSLAECLIAPVRAGHEEAVLEALAAVHVGVVPVDVDTAVEAARLRAQSTSLRLPDAIVMALAQQLDGDVLTVEASWAAVSDRVRTIAALW